MQTEHSPVTLVTRLAGAIVKEGRAMVKRVPPVSPEQIEQRMSLCRMCEMYDPAQNRCNACGCFLAAKTAFRSAECDLGKWGSIEG